MQHVTGLSADQSHLYMFVVFTALITTLVLCTRIQNLVLSVSVRRVHVVFSTAGFKGRGNPCRMTSDTTSLRRGIQKASRI